jgi:CO dehydrogenase/acetyl-CoA synthase complex epsilon subunit
LTSKNIHVKIGEMKNSIGHIKNQELSIGKVVDYSWSTMHIGNRLVDPTWQGLDGKGHPDLALFVGLPYYMKALILSGLKHFAPNLKTMTLDNMYHPHAI